MKKLPILLLALLLSVNMIFFLLNGCCGDKRKYCGYYYKASLAAWDNADSTPSLATKPVPAKALYLEVKLGDTTYLCSAPIFPINAALAFKCGLREERVKIDSFSLTSDHDFDAAHPAGSNLADLFRYDTVKYLNKLANIPSTMYLMHSPADTGTHTFTIRLFATDSSKNLIASTTPVKLLL